MIAIQKTSLRVALIFMVGAFIFWPSVSIVAGVSLGAVIGMVNFYFLTKVILKLTSELTSHKGGWAGLLMIKIATLLGVVAVVLIKLNIHPIAFAVGFSSVLVGIFYHGFNDPVKEGKGS